LAVRLRTLTEDDYAEWFEVRARCRDWLVPWEPRPDGSPTTPEDRASFVARCAARERERQMGTGYGFGIFVEGRLAGEITLSSIQRGPFQNAFVGYWVDRAMAGQGLAPEATVAVLRFAFEELACTGSRWPSSPATGPAGGWSRSSSCAKRGGSALPRDRRAVGGPRPLRHHLRGVDAAARRADPGVDQPD
jgi:hypothetical protein